MLNLILLAGILLSSSSISVNAKISYDAEFWEGFEDNKPPYEHDWKNIPDFIDKEVV